VIPTDARVFIVDDDPDFARSLERLLRTAGASVETFGSAREFLGRSPLDGPACVVVDLRMPEVDGLELQDVLVRSVRRLPVILISGVGEISDSVQAMRNGAIDFLTKPVDEAHLLEAVERAITFDREQREQRLLLADARQRMARLTPREKQVCQLVSKGLLNKQVAWELGLSEQMVKAHRQQVMSKLQVDSVAALVRLLDLAGDLP
jgi:FixJ family two-component response regulator